MPKRVRDYVMVHELMHLRRLDHSSHYWRLVAKAYPDHERARTWLRVHGPALLLSGEWLNGHIGLPYTRCSTQRAVSSQEAGNHSHSLGWGIRLVAPASI